MSWQYHDWSCLRKSTGFKQKIFKLYKWSLKVESSETIWKYTHECEKSCGRFGIISTANVQLAQVHNTRKVSNIEKETDIQWQEGEVSTVRLNSAELTLKHLKTTLSKGNKKEEKFHSCRGKITHRCAPTELRKKYLTKKLSGKGMQDFHLLKKKQSTTQRCSTQ